ncbi:MAG: hypothetical protein GX620_04005 [Chloroflexi bacterium]|nr:hypothetical protein [Chloroflexota bacterium]
MIEERVAAQAAVPADDMTEPYLDDQPPVWIAVTPFLHDYEHRTRRPGRREKMLAALQWTDADSAPGQTVGQAIMMHGVDPRVEPIEAYAMVLEHARHPDPVAYPSQAGQIEFLLALSEVYSDEPLFPTIEFSHEHKIREAAYQHYRDCIARYTPPLLEDTARSEIARIVCRARQNLMEAS